MEEHTEKGLGASATPSGSSGLPSVGSAAQDPGPTDPSRDTVLELRQPTLIEASDALIAKEREYRELIGAELDEVIPFMWAHDWKTSRYMAGVKLRAELIWLDVAYKAAKHRATGPESGVAGPAAGGRSEANPEGTGRNEVTERPKEP